MRRSLSMRCTASWYSLSNTARSLGPLDASMISCKPAAAITFTTWSRISGPASPAKLQTLSRRARSSSMVRSKRAISSFWPVFFSRRLLISALACTKSSSSSSIAWKPEPVSANDFVIVFCRRLPGAAASKAGAGASGVPFITSRAHSSYIGSVFSKSAAAGEEPRSCMWTVMRRATCLALGDCSSPSLLDMKPRTLFNSASCL
mmetsp:Transcript_45658/g.108725  ORF Transcript_45658/g.108725 Transcript_45658/m.108725 type:complete len:204 (+) Transcript_45658:938-1549(+)